MNGGARNVIAGEYAAEALAEVRWAALQRQNSALQQLRALTMNDAAFSAWQKANLTGDAATNMRRIQAEIDRLHNACRMPSFFAQMGRKPVAGQDYDPDKPMDRDEAEYLTGTGRYTDEPTACTCPACAAAQAIEDDERPDDLRRPDSAGPARKAYDGKALPF